MLIAIEGIDGSGKGTISDLLRDHLREGWWTVSKRSFPQYETSKHGGIIGRYLNGDFGAPVNPYHHGAMYALDRLEALRSNQLYTSCNGVLLLDRYVPTNLAYSAMLAKEEERDAVLKYLVWLEYELLQLPKPDLIVYLDVPVAIAAENVAKKAKRVYTDKSSDQLEADLVYLEGVRDFYLNTLMKYHPTTKFKVVQCTNADGMLQPVVILNQVIDHIFGDK